MPAGVNWVVKQEVVLASNANRHNMQSKHDIDNDFNILSGIMRIL